MTFMEICCTSFEIFALLLGLVTRRKDVKRFFTNIVTSTVKYREDNKINRPDFLQLLINMKNENLLTIEQIVSNIISLIFLLSFSIHFR